MSAKHTQGRLRIAGRETRGLPHTLVAANTLLFRVYSEAFGDVEQEGANARRLVACWNACDGIPTEVLEHYYGDKGGLDAALDEASLRDHTTAAQQRDELLAALRRLSFAALCRDSTMGDPCRLIEVKAELAAAAKAADAAIAKATNHAGTGPANKKDAHS